MGREKSNYWKMHSRYRTDGGDIDLFLIAGPSVRQVVERYTDLTGKSALLPRYPITGQFSIQQTGCKCTTRPKGSVSWK